MRSVKLDEAQTGRLLGEILVTSHMQMTLPLMAESEEELKNLSMKVKEESEKVALKLNIQKTKIITSSPIISWQKDRETVRVFILGGSKITEDSTCIMKLKEAFSLEEKL